MSLRSKHVCLLASKDLICPWIDETEWKAVCSWLYGQGICEKRKGVARVVAWKARGTVPFPVETTADIVECLVRDRSDAIMEETLRFMFSMAIVSKGVWPPNY